MLEITVMVTNPVTRDMHTRTPFIKAGEVEAFVTTRNPWQQGHRHSFDVWDKHGDGLCIGCGAQAWSAWWVAEDVYGTGTEAWVAEGIRMRELMVAKTQEVIVERVMGAIPLPPADRDLDMAIVRGEVILAAFDGDAPAKQVGRRAGIPVPAMAFGVTEIQ